MTFASARDDSDEDDLCAARFCGMSLGGLPPIVEATVVEEDEYEPGDDEEQDMLYALSLLEQAKDAMTLMAACLDFRKVPTGEQEVYITMTLMDIKQFLSALDNDEELKVEARRKRPGPRMKLSSACVTGKHGKCEKVNCDCHCHSDEWLEETK